MKEFELIERFFTIKPQRSSTLVSVGDDCALLKAKADHNIAISTDSMVLGTHFFADMDAYKLGQKALATNLSDLAAMGAKPLAFLLALTLPEVDESWLEPFSRGLRDMACDYKIDLVGGNIARGSLNITITVIGSVAQNKAFRRDAAKVGDDIYVTGTLGGAALALRALRHQVKLNDEIFADALACFESPIPRLQLAQDLVGIARAAIDISDGLAQDLGHVLDASKVGAQILAELIPVFEHSDLQSALHGGEDYELCFTALPDARKKIENLSTLHQIPITRIGTILDGSDLELLDVHNCHHLISSSGFQHFKE